MMAPNHALIHNDKNSLFYCVLYSRFRTDVTQTEQFLTCLLPEAKSSWFRLTSDCCGGHFKVICTDNLCLHHPEVEMIVEELSTVTTSFQQI